MKLTLVLALILAPALSLSAAVVDISGEVANPNTTVGAGNSARCIADAYFGWQTGNCAIDVDNNGFLFGLDSGNGNPLNYSGVVSGGGGMYFKGGPAYAGTKDVPVILSGSTPNTYAGASSITYGVLQLSKDAGVTAIPSDITVGGDTVDINGNDKIVWTADNQIADTATITMQGTLASWLVLDGNADTVAGLVVGAAGMVDTGAGGQLQTQTLTVNGTPQSAGTYTSSESWIDGSGSVVVVPEPSMLLLAGLAGLVMIRRK
jgi:hypothetical protein